jgi:hypothetical protein
MADPTRRSTRFSMRSKQIGQLLLDNGDVQSEQIAAALEQQEQSGGMIGQILQANGACNAQTIAQALLKQVQVTDVKPEELTVPYEIATLVNREFCEAEKLCPFEQLGSLLCIVMGNPLNRRAISQIEQNTHLKVKSFKSVWPKIKDLIERTYNAPQEGEAQQVEAGEVALEQGGEQGDFSLEQNNEAPTIEIPQDDPLLADEPAQPAIIRTPAARQSQPPQRRQAAPPPQAPDLKIKGIDDLDEANAEVIETNRRGLSARPRPLTPEESGQRPKVVKVAKVNVNLDDLDITSGEVVKTGGIEDDEHLEEIAYDGVVHPVPLKMVHDSYFFENGKAPLGERSDELLLIISEVPLAETVAQSIGELREQLAANPPKPKAAERSIARASAVAVQAVATASATATVDRPLELQPSPIAIMQAVPIAEIEFQRFVAKLGEDPVGEWDWQFSAPGPIAVTEYEEN